MNINKKIKSGLTWSFLNQGYSLLSQFTFGIWLARILGPEAYGTIAMVTVFSRLAQMLLDFGFSSALIHKQNVTDKDYSTIFWFNLFISVVLYVLFYLSSSLIADFYNKEELELYSKIVGLQFILSAFGITQRVKLTKRIDFKTKTLISICSGVISYILAIFFALNGYGVWAIIIQNLTSRLLSIIFLFIKLSWIPSLSFSRKSFISLYKFGLALTGDSLLNYFSRNSDNFLIGKYLGDSSLGIYSKSYNIILFPIRNFSDVIKKVLFPSFSLIQSNKKTIKNYYFRTTSMIIYVIFPLMIILNLNANEFILILLGEDWVKMVPLVKIFAVLGMIQSVLTINGTIYLSLGKAALAFKISLLTNFISLLCIIVGVYFGSIYSVAIGLAIAQVINFYPVFVTVLKLLDSSFNDFFQSNKMIFVAIFISSLLSYSFSCIEIEGNLLKISLSTFIYYSLYFGLSYNMELEPFSFIFRKVKDSIK